MNNEMDKNFRIYSLNLSAFLIAKTLMAPEIQRDEDNGLYYCVFKECQAVSEAIKEYKDYNRELYVEDLRAFMTAFKNIKRDIYEKRMMEKK